MNVNHINTDPSYLHRPDWKQAKATSPTTFLGSILTSTSPLRHIRDTISTVVQCYRTGVPFKDCLTIWQRLLVPNGEAKAIMRFVKTFSTHKGHIPRLKIDPSPKPDNRTPLHFAVCADDRTVLKRLVEQGADVNTQDSEGMTPLHYATHLKQIETTEWLLEQGADSNILNSYGDTPYFIMQSHREFTNTKSIKMASQRDNGATQEMMDRTLLAQRYGLLGISALSGSLLNFASYTTLPTVKALQDATASYYRRFINASEDVNSPEWNSILERLSERTLQKVEALDRQTLNGVLNETVNAITTCLPNNADAVMQRYSYGLPVAIATSWPGSAEEVGHSVSLVIFDKKIAFCNRSPSKGEKPGIWIYTIGNKEALKVALEQCVPETTKSYFTQQIISDLALHDPIHIPLERQNTPNCAVANSNNIELMVLFFLLKPLLGSKAALEIARAFKQDRIHDTRTNALNAYLTRHSQPQPFPPDLGLLGQIYDKAHRQISILIEKWANSHQVDLKAISQLGILQAFLGSPISSIIPNSILLQKAYKAQTDDVKISTEMRTLTDRWANLHRLKA